MAETRVHLEPSEFWKIVAKLRQVEALRAELRAHVLQADANIDRVAKEGQGLFDSAATRYGFNPSKPCRFDEDDTAFVFDEDDQ